MIVNQKHELNHLDTNRSHPMGAEQKQAMKAHHRKRNKNKNNRGGYHGDGGHYNQGYGNQ